MEISSNLITIATAVGIFFLAFMTIGMIFARLYTRATKELTFVRTGFGGQKVIKDGGSLVLPVLHDLIWVNMNTLRLEVNRANEQALITQDRMRVDVTAEFYVRVQPDENAIATAAQTLGDRTTNPEKLKSLIEGKFVDALRSVAAGMTMEALHESRAEFVQEVQNTSAEDLMKNGLELESVSLTGLDQTAREYFNPDNAFDAEGLTKLTGEIEERRKKRNDIEQDTRIQIEQKDLETEKISLSIKQENEFARLAQVRAIANETASQEAEIAQVAAEKRRELEQANIVSAREVELSRIDKDRATREKNIEANRLVSEREIGKEKSIELANQDRDIAIADKSKDRSKAQADADLARSEAVREAENVLTVQQTAEAQRDKDIELIKAAEAAERQTIGVRVAATAEKDAAGDHAAAIRLEAEARAQATQVKYEAEAEGTRVLNEAKNVLNQAQISLAVNLAMIDSLPDIIRETVKPAEKIESIKILDVSGLSGIGGGSSGNDNTRAGGSGNVADGLIGALLKYQATSPLLKKVLSELDLEGLDPRELMSTGGLAAEVIAAASPKAQADSKADSAPSNAAQAGDEEQSE